MKTLALILGVAGLALIAMVLLRNRRDGHRATEERQGREPRFDPARHVAEIVAPLQKPCILLRKSREESKSYLGGLPPSHRGFDWPSKDGRPLSFLCCIDLAEIPTIEWLPRSGLLLFFYDMEKQPWGFDPADRGGWSVLYVEDAATVDGDATAPDELAKEGRLPRHSLTLVPASLPPPWELAPLFDPDDSDEESEALFDALGAQREAQYQNVPKHQMGGYPEPIQSAEMDLECQLVTNGLYLGDARGYSDPRAEALKDGAAEWRLLLQLDSDDELGVMWGDVGMIYFWVREPEARRGEFGGTWLILQCY